MGTTSEGIVYPDPADVPQRQDLQDIAESTNAALLALGFVQAGEITITVPSGNATATDTVIFPTAFTTAPVVILTTNQRFYRANTAGLASATSVDVRASHINSGTGGASVTVYWLARTPS